MAGKEGTYPELSAVVCSFPSQKGALSFFGYVGRSFPHLEGKLPSGGIGKMALKKGFKLFIRTISKVFTMKSSTWSLFI